MKGTDFLRELDALAPDEIMESMPADIRNAKPVSWEKLPKAHRTTGIRSSGKLPFILIGGCAAACICGVALLFRNVAAKPEMTAQNSATVMTEITPAQAFAVTTETQTSARLSASSTTVNSTETALYTAETETEFTFSTGTVTETEKKMAAEIQTKTEQVPETTVTEAVTVQTEPTAVTKETDAASKTAAATTAAPATTEISKPITTEPVTAVHTAPPETAAKTLPPEHIFENGKEILFWDEKTFGEKYQWGHISMPDNEYAFYTSQKTEIPLDQVGEYIDTILISGYDVYLDKQYHMDAEAYAVNGSEDTIAVKCDEDGKYYLYRYYPAEQHVIED